MMITNRVFAMAALVISITGASWAATPDQAGTWSGSAKVSTFTGGTNKTVSKQAMQIEIALDDSTTVTVGGVQQAVGTIIYNATDCLITYGPPPGTTSAFIATFNFKNTTMKGSATGFTQGGGVLINTLEAKYKLKKQ
jgi:hypothetical protein